jgi:hypothetical protein
MTFTLHLLRTQDGLTEGTVSLLDDAVEMLDRISTTVKSVLVESGEGTSAEISGQ